jgi:3-methyladenine DNA glycosylase AlkD
MKKEHSPEAEDVHAALQALASGVHRKKMKGYFTTSQALLGVNNPGIRLVVKECRQSLMTWDSQQWISLAGELVHMGIFECQIAGFELLAGNRKVLSEMSGAEAGKLMVNLDNWASVDHFSVGIHGVLWRDGAIPGARIHELLASENVWERRVAVVSTVSLNTRSRGGRGDALRTLEVCGEVVDERHPMIWKALSWALRSLIYWDAAAVESFLNEHREQLSKQVLREVRHKLDHGTKN